MGIWQNIILSFTLHTIIIATTIVVYGRGMPLYAPAGYMEVSIVEDMPAINSRHKSGIPFHGPSTTYMEESHQGPKPAKEVDKITSSMGVPGDYHPEEPYPDRAGLLTDVEPDISIPVHPIKGNNDGIDKRGRPYPVDTIQGDGKDKPSYATIRERIEMAKRYPLSARRQGIEGRVVLRFRIMRDGGVKDIRIIEGSGYEILDMASIETVRRAVPLPYVEGWIEISLLFKLDS